MSARRSADTPAGGDLPQRIEGWLAKPAIRIVHKRTARASVDALWRAAQTVELDDTRSLGRMVRWRIPGLRDSLTFGELFREEPFVVLEEGRRHSISGLCGRIWTLARDYPHLDDAAAFAGWREPGTVRVLFAHWIEPAGDGTSTLLSESRVAPVDRGAAFRLRALWALVAVFERLIGAEPLEIAVRRAEEGQR